MTATTVRFAAVRQDGRYRVVTTGVGAAAPGRVVATCSSKAKAEEKAAKLNAEVVVPGGVPAVVSSAEPFTAQLQAEAAIQRAEGAPADARSARATELAEAVVAGQVSFDAAATELLGGAPAAQQDDAAAARVLPRTDVEDRVEASMARKATKAEAAPAEDKPVNVYVGASVAELIIPRTDDADASVAAVARKLADRQPNAQNYRHVKLSAAERGALAGVATAIENDATTAGQGLLARAARTLRARIAATD